VPDSSKTPASQAGSGARNDLACTGWSVTCWWLCGAAIVVGFGTPRWRPLLWIAGMGVAGTLCLINAARCHRTHCYITGPVFLAGALLTALNVAGITAIPWQWLGLGVVIGVVCGILVESFLGRYAKNSDTTNRC
jgi:hypothetical protein